MTVNSIVLIVVHHQSQLRLLEKISLSFQQLRCLRLVTTARTEYFRHRFVRFIRRYVHETFIFSYASLYSKPSNRVNIGRILMNRKPIRSVNLVRIDFLTPNGSPFCFSMFSERFCIFPCPHLSP